jgi:hypothetical protein
MTPCLRAAEDAYLSLSVAMLHAILKQLVTFYFTQTNDRL